MKLLMGFVYSHQRFWPLIYSITSFENSKKYIQNEKKLNVLCTIPNQRCTQIAWKLQGNITEKI